MDDLNNFQANIDNFETTWGILGVLLFGFVCLAIYALPSVIAICRRHEQQVIIILINIFCAWTGIIWLAIFVWSLWPRDKRPQYAELHLPNFQNGQQPQNPPPFQSEPNASPSREKSTSLSEERLASLEKLGRLKKEGILNEEEFVREKEKIFKSNG